MSELIKDLLFGDDCREKLINGVSKVAKAVGSTMGPSGRTVLIESSEHTKSITVTKDGFNVAKSIILLDPVENMAATILKEAAFNSATTTGDGTTAAIVIAESIILAGNKLLKEGVNQTQVLRYINQLTTVIVEKLKSSAIPCTDDILFDVAKISANNDETIGKIIAETYKNVGKSGIVSISKSTTTETYADITNGLKIDRGYASPYFVTNREKDTCVMENVKILVCDTEITNFLQIEKVIGPAYKNNDNILIIAPCNQNTLNTLVANAIANGPNRQRLNVCVVNPPSFGFRQHELMQDIALSTGAAYYSQSTGDDLSHISYASLGLAEKIIISKNKTEIIGPQGNESEIIDRVNQLTEAKKIAQNKSDKDFIDERIASLTGGVGVIYVGGNTDIEQKELYDRIEDAVCAVRSALEEGIVSGAGKALYEITIDETGDRDFEVARSIILQSIKRPLTQILQNADLDHKEIYQQHGEFLSGFGYNVKTGETGNLVKMGVIDPVKVVRSSLQNAVSVATTILSTNSSINIIRA